MTFKDHLTACHNLLNSWSIILEKEILKNYPHEIPFKLESMIESMMNLDEESLLNIQNCILPQVDVSQELKAYLQSIQDLTSFEQLELSSINFPDALTRKVDDKKLHELKQLHLTLKDLKDFSNVLDIGGGVGFLSTMIAQNFNCHVTSLDFNKQLQASGQERIQKWNLKKVKFIHSDFNQMTSLKDFDNLDNRLVIGLHSCGELGTKLIQYGAKSQCNQVVLASCCYHKLNGSYNISFHAQKHPFDFSINALHLASRASKIEDFNAFQNKLRVRKYRYLLHMLEYDKGHKDFRSIGNTKLSDYQLSFTDYVQRYSLFNDLSIEDSEEFFSNTDNHLRVKKIIFADILRSLLGRVVETYIILDRAIFLEEAGYKTKIIKAFNQNISPRNLLILASRS